MKREVAVGFFVLGTMLMMFFYQNELLLFGLMAAGTTVALALDKWKNLKYFFIAMVVGGICENIAVFLGAWDYANANYLFTPLWLPIGWGLSVVLLEELFAGNSSVSFSKTSVVLAFGGTLCVGFSYPDELGILLSFMLITVILFALNFYKRQEFIIGFCAAFFGTAMEFVCISTGAWTYSFAWFGTPLWLPLCWFNAFLIMRRVIRFGEMPPAIPKAI